MPTFLLNSKLLKAREVLVFFPIALLAPSTVPGTEPTLDHYFLNE